MNAFDSLQAGPAPWYSIAFAALALDAIFPVLPGETEPAAWERLVQVETAYGPRSLFRIRHNIRTRDDHA